MSDTFYCRTLRCSGLSYETCIRRQLAKKRTGDSAGGTRFPSKYSDCRDCRQGKRIMDEHPELVALAKKPRRYEKLDMTPPKEKIETFYFKEPDINKSLEDIARGKEKREMARKFKEKKCGCGNTFTPTGPRQDKCEDCKKGRAGSSMKKKKRKTAKKSPRKKLTRQNPKKEKLPLPPGNRQYTFTVDLSSYPEVHKKLIELAQEEFRTPEMQLAKMLDEEIRRREIAA